MNTPLAVDNTAFEDSPRARTRFRNIRAKASKFVAMNRNYKAPDFGRMILDLRNLGWSHEKIAYVLNGVSCSSVVSMWATGSSIPNFVNGDQFIILWRDQTGIERFPRIGEYEYRYKIGQLDFLDDLDNVIEQLDGEIER